MSIKKLEKTKDELIDELYMLHFAEPSPELYIQRRYEIEHQIASIEDTIDFKKKMLPFKYMLYGFIMIAIGLLIWAYVVIK